MSNWTPEQFQRLVARGMVDARDLLPRAAVTATVPPAPKPIKPQPAHDPHPDGQIPHPEPKRHKATALGAAVRREEKSLPRTRVRFVGYRVRPLDPDNFAGSCKDLLDGLRHAALIRGDEPWRIIFETEQVRVGKFSEEKTVIEIETQSEEYPSPTQ